MKKLIKLYGERNTNTNYMSKLVQLNLDVLEVPGVVPPIIMMLQRILPGRELVRDFYFSRTYKHNLGWKHTKVKPVSELKAQDIPGNDLSFLTITKNPYSWLLSLYKRPYHQYYKKKPDFETFLRTPWKTVGRDNCGAMLRSPIELWNIKNHSYLRLAELKSLNITTESIFQDPKAVIERISNELSIDKLSGEFVNFEESTKERRKNFAYYQDYYLNERWRDSLSEAAISIIDQDLDRDLMDHFGYAELSSNSVGRRT